MARSDVLRTATLRYHAGELTLAEWSACVAEFRRDATRPPVQNRGPRHERQISE